MLELPRHLVDSSIIEGAALRITGENEILLHRPHVFIEVIGADFLHEGVGVGEEELKVITIFLLQHVIMEPNYTSEIGYELRLT